MITSAAVTFYFDPKQIEEHKQSELSCVGRNINNKCNTHNTHHTIHIRTTTKQNIQHNKYLGFFWTLRRVVSVGCHAKSFRCIQTTPSIFFVYLDLDNLVSTIVCFSSLFHSYSMLKILNELPTLTMAIMCI